MKNPKMKKIIESERTRQTFAKIFGSYEQCPIYNGKRICWVWTKPTADDICYSCPHLRIINKENREEYEMETLGYKQSDWERKEDDKNHPKKTKFQERSDVKRKKPHPHIFMESRREDEYQRRLRKGQKWKPKEGKKNGRNRH